MTPSGPQAGELAPEVESQCTTSRRREGARPGHTTSTRDPLDKRTAPSVKAHTLKHQLCYRSGQAAHTRQ